MSASSHAPDPASGQPPVRRESAIHGGRIGTDQLLRNALALRRRLVIARNDWRWRSERATLEAEKGWQRERFRQIAKDAPDAYHELRRWSIEDYVMPEWVMTLHDLERDLSAGPSFDFLRHPTVMATMVILAGGRVLRQEVAFFEQRLGREQLAWLLEEDLVGQPVLMEGSYRTSHSVVHHLYHLLRFASATGADPAAFERTVEWGAGYGGFARVHRRWHGGRPTQVLIDLPVLSLIQWLYLSTVFGPEEVLLVTSPEATIQPGKISIVPVGLAAAVTGRTDLFVSTWALSESAAAAQDFVVGADWFGAKHLLLAYQEASPHFPKSSQIGTLAEADGASLEAVGVLRGNRYAFR